MLLVCDPHAGICETYAGNCDRLSLICDPLAAARMVHKYARVFHNTKEKDHYRMKTGKVACFEEKLISEIANFFLRCSDLTAYGKRF